MAKAWEELQGNRSAIIERLEKPTLGDKAFGLWWAASAQHTKPTVIDRLVDLKLEHRLTPKSAIKAVFPSLVR